MSSPYQRVAPAATRPSRADISPGPSRPQPSPVAIAGTGASRGDRPRLARPQPVSEAQAHRARGDAAVANGAKGIVVAGVGDGNFTTPALDALKRARAKGVNVVRSSRVGSGIIRRNIEVNDDELGSVASIALNPAKARVLLKLALTKTQDPKAIQTYFDTY
jgi:hypothetical protein